MNPQFILLCKGNQGKQLLQQNILQIRLYQLQTVNKLQILKHYARVSKIPTEPINLITKKRNHYIDMLLSKNQQLIANHNQQNQTITSSKIDLPLQLQVIYPDQQHLIESQVNVDLSYFNVLQKIGQGTFAQIFLAQQKYDRKLVCIKRVNKTQLLQHGSKQMLLNQYTALKYRHRHKVNLLFMFQNNQYVFFVTDYCVFGDLYSLIQNQKQTHDCQQCQKLDKYQKYSIWLQVAFMIIHMHQKGFIYRDLKPQNILIDQRGFIKLCDFGYCTKYQKNQSFKQICGTLEYIPPQLASGQSYDKTIDIYGLGILLYELIANKTPFQGITFDNMQQNKLQPIKFDNKLFTQNEKNLILSLTKQNPQQRLGYFNSLTIFKHILFDEKQVMNIIKDIINNVPNYYMLLKLHDKQSKQYEIRIQKQGQYEKFFQKSYNYLNPNFQIQQKIGPKFNSSF